MEPSRFSKRVQGLAPDGSQNSKRRPKPNTNSLLAFEELQSSQTTQTTTTKRRRARTVNSDPKEQVPDPATSSPQAQRQKTSAGEADKEVVDVTSSPAQIRTPTTAPTKARPTFDPKVLFDKEAQHVGFNMWPIINKNRQNAIVKNWDINSISDRITYKRMCDIIWRMGIQPWIEKRSLLPSERPIKQAFEFLFGNPNKPTLTLNIRDQETFDDALIPLRIYKHKKLATANEITVNAYYKTPEDEDSSPSEDEKYQGKGKKRSKGKSKADRARDTVRPTSLVRESSGISALDSDPFRDSSDGEARASPTPRDSVTQRRLNAKREMEKDLAPEEVSRAEVFGHNTCTERLCNNQKKCCYVMRKAGTHHRINIERQIEWAAAINAKVPGVTKTQPPPAWIVDFAEGDCKTNYMPKLSGGRKSDQATVETTPKVDQGSSSIDKLTQLLLLQTVQTMSNQASTLAPLVFSPATSGPSTIRESRHLGYANGPQIHTNSAQHSAPEASGHTSMLIPSSPLKPLDEDENEVELMGQWMIQREKNSKRREQLNRGFELMVEAFVMDLSQLRDVPFITSLDIPAGIAHYIKDNVSEFKKVYKESRHAAVDLINLSNGATVRQSMTNAGSGEDEEFNNFFVEY